MNLAGLRLLLAGVLGAPLLLSCASLSPLRWGSRLPPRGDVGLHRWQQKSVHNAFERDEPVREQLGRHGFRSVEFDVHNGKWGRPRLDGEWYVYHVDFPGFDGSSCKTLGACLGEIDAWHRANPGHEVLTLFVDLKDEFAPGHDPSQLDARIEGALAPGALYKPADLMARCPGATSLRQAVTGGCAWPSLGELRGKVAVALTGGDVCSRRSRLSTYAGEGADAARRAAFVAPNVRSSCPFDGHERRAPYAVVFNLDHASLAEAPKIARAGLISRAYYGGLTGGLDDPESWQDARSAGVQFLATDRVDAERYPWTDLPAPLAGAGHHTP